jgi:ATP-dependent RNA helicase HelY
VTDTAADRPFTLDRFQIEANTALDAGQSVLVAAPTGSGKTVVAEHAVARALAEGRKVFYTTPIKALSNQKFGDFVARYGPDRVGLLTGDNAVNGDAPIVVMTTEVLRNMIYAGSPALKHLAYVVLDEVHYLQDPYRGPVWEEVIIHLPHDVRLVCLSATVSNSAELAGWITDLRGPTATIVEHERPVELINLYAAYDRSAQDLMVIPTVVDGGPNRFGEKMDAEVMGKPRRHREGGRPRKRWATPRRLEVVEFLDDQDLLPAIYFIFSRAACDDAARSMLDAGVRLTTPEEQRSIRRIVEERTAGIGDRDRQVLGYDRWLAGLEMGVGAHHAGMVPPFKEAVESCFSEGLVKVVFATETLALGINMPARSVVIENLSKFTGERHEPLTPGAYTQLTGRAGRRGIDEVGHALVLWSPFVPFEQVADLALSRRFVLTSSFRPTYNMTANLVRHYDEDRAHHLLNQSFAQYQADRSVVKLEGRRAALHRTLGELLAAATCERGSVSEYRDLQRADERNAKNESHRRDVYGAVARLAPGDVITVADDRAAVLSVAHRSNGALKLTVVTSRGRLKTLPLTELDEVPHKLGEIVLPLPYAPNNRQFQKEAAHLLSQARLKPKTGRAARRIEPPAAQAQDHPVADCPDRRDHLRAAVQAERVQREIDDLDRRVAARDETVSKAFDRVVRVLTDHGHLDGWELTARGELLVRIYHECDLLLAEALATGLFDDLDASSLAGLASCVVYEHRSKQAPPAPWFPNKGVRERFARLERIANDLNRAERAARLPETRLPDPTFFALAHAWSAGEDLDAVLADEDLTGGDFVRTMKQLIDLLRQLALTAPVPATARAAQEAADRLFRGIVSASSVLPEADDADPGGTKLSDAGADGEHSLVASAADHPAALVEPGDPAVADGPARGRGGRTVGGGGRSPAGS